VEVQAQGNGSVVVTNVQRIEDVRKKLSGKLPRWPELEGQTDELREKEAGDQTSLARNSNVLNVFICGEPLHPSPYQSRLEQRRSSPLELTRSQLSNSKTRPHEGAWHAGDRPRTDTCNRRPVNLATEKDGRTLRSSPRSSSSNTLVPEGIDQLSIGLCAAIVELVRVRLSTPPDEIAVNSTGCGEAR
jgi:hypothetical protein